MDGRVKYCTADLIRDSYVTHGGAVEAPLENIQVRQGRNGVQIWQGWLPEKTQEVIRSLKVSTCSLIIALAETCCRGKARLGKA